MTGASSSGYDPAVYLFPNATSKLDELAEAKREMVKAWAKALDGGIVEPRLEADGDRAVLRLHDDWDSESRRALTQLFHGFVCCAYRCLDTLIQEAAVVNTAQRRLEVSAEDLFFPIADSFDSFEAFASEGALVGLPESLILLLFDSQPSRGKARHPKADLARLTLSRLLDWDTRLAAGQSVCPWVTPDSPRVYVPGWVTLVDRIVGSPGPVDPTAEIVSFSWQGAMHPKDITIDIDGLIELGFVDAEVDRPGNASLPGKLAEVEAGTRQFVRLFVREYMRTGGALAIRGGSGEPTWWPEGGSSPISMRELENSETGVAELVGSDALTLFVTDGEKLYRRVVPEATPVRAGIERGKAAEHATLDAVATWGLPDFVVYPQTEQKGSGVREISDGLIIVGRRGLIIQTKTREVNSGDPAKEGSWINKQVTKACRQVSGTHRRLRTKPMKGRNARNRPVTFDGRNVDWSGVVIVDHPTPPDQALPPTKHATVPIVVLLRRDWEFLFNQLRSTTAVVDYIFRVESSTGALGAEPARYYELARSDLKATPPGRDSGARALPRLAGNDDLGFVSVPLLPMAPPAQGGEGFSLFRHMMEDIALSDDEEGDPAILLDSLGALDSLPVGLRGELGDLLLGALASCRGLISGSFRWQARVHFEPHGTRSFLFAAMSELHDESQELFRSRVLLLHHEQCARLPNDVVDTFGVVLTPRNGSRRWDTTFVRMRGPSGLDEHEAVRLTEFFETVGRLGDQTDEEP